MEKKIAGSTNNQYMLHEDAKINDINVTASV